MAQGGSKQLRRDAVDLVQLHHGRETRFSRVCGRAAGTLGLATGGLAEFDDERSDPRPHRLILGQRSEETHQGRESCRVQIDLAVLFFDRDRGLFAARQTAS